MTEQLTRRDEILDAAENRYFRTGYKKTTLAEIAGDLGLVKSALYKHFRNKEELFEAVLNRIINRIMSKAEKAAEKKTKASDKLYAMLISSYEDVLILNKRFDSSPEVWHDLRPHVLRVDRLYFSRFVKKIGEIIEYGKSTGELNSSNPEMVGMMIHMFFSSLHELIFLGEIRIEDGYKYIRFTIDTILSGIKIDKG